MIKTDNSYDCNSTVPDINAVLNDFVEKSNVQYQKSNVRRDLHYGRGNRETVDWFYSPNNKNGNTIVFIHGGYWQWCNKDQFALITEAPLEAGFDVVLVEYSLTPEVTLTKLTAQVGKSLDFIHDRLQKAGKTSAKVILSGHSAGGHLAAYWQGHPMLSATFPISGLFDLEPLIPTPLDDNITLTMSEVTALSPMRNIPANPKPLGILYGANELPNLVNQSLNYHKILASKGVKADIKGVENKNHFSVLTDVFSKNGEILNLIRKYI